MNTYPLFEHMITEHGLPLMESEMQAILAIARRIIEEDQKEVEELETMGDKLIDPAQKKDHQKIYDALKTKCPKCGIDLTGAMGYVCTVHECPVQLKVTC